MEKNKQFFKGVGALRLVSVLCFWVALALFFVPAGDMAAPVSAEAQMAGERLEATSVQPVAPTSTRLIPLGRTTGIKMFSEGTMVVGFGKLDECGGKSPAQTAGARPGDIIVAVNGQAVTSNEDLVARLKQIQDPKLKLTVKRDGKTLDLNVTGVMDSGSKSCKIGAWVRDSIAGIGTITFVDPKNGAFGALGHGISDTDTGQLVEFKEGSIMESTVADVKKGRAGEPGELTGRFDLSRNQGVLFSNTGKGIFGQLTDERVYQDGQALKVARRSEIKEGKAYIVSNVQGAETRQYEIEIVRLYDQSQENSRDMMICVTDPELIEITGGIVQGMSGSPILQNGKLVGAVTHVLINDPLRGYGICIENMLAAAAT